MYDNQVLNLNKLKLYLFLMFIIFLPIEDFMTGNLPTTVLTANIAVFPLLILLCLNIKKFCQFICSKYKYIIYIYFFILVNIIMAIYYYNSYDIEYSNYVIYYKAFSNFVIFIFFLFSAYISFIMFSQYNIKVFDKYILISLLIVIVGMIFNFLFPYTFDSDIFHHGYINAYDGRVRGFSNEPSNLSYTLSILYGLYLAIKKLNYNSISKYYVIIAMNIAIESKGMIYLSFIYIGITVYMFSENIIIKKMLKITTCIIIILLLWFLIYDLKDYYGIISGYLMMKGTSFSTRSVMFLIWIKSLGIVWGNGFTGYYAFILKNIPWGINVTTQYIPFRLKYFELVETFATVKNVGTKTLFGDYVIIFGIPFALLYSYTFLKLLKFAKKINSSNLFFLILMVFLPPITYVPVVPFSYSAMLALGFILSLKHTYNIQNVST